MRIEQQAIDYLCKYIKNNFCLYENFFNQEIKNIPTYSYNFDETIEYCLKNVVGFDELSQNNTTKTTKDFLTNRKRVLKQKQKRYKTSIYNKTLDRSSKMYSDIEGIFFMYKLQPALLISIFNTSSLDDYVEQLINANKIWYIEKKSLLEHPYISHLGKEKIDYFYIDLSIDILEFILNKDSNFIDFTRVYANQLVDAPWFAPTSRKIPDSDISYVEGTNNKQQAIYNISEKDAMVYRIEKGNIQAMKKFKTLDSKDFELLNKILSFASNSTYFIKTGEVEFNTVDVAKHVFNIQNPAKNHYDSIEEKLEYIRCIEFKEYRKDVNQTYLYSLIDDVIIDHNLNKIKVKFSDVIVQNFVNNKLTFINNHYLEQLKLPLSKRLIAILQRERYSLCNLEVLSEGSLQLTKKYDYTFFSGKFIFMSKSAKKNWSMIKESLQELSDNNIIINSFKMNIDNTISIQYKPLTTSEINDSMLRQQSILDLIESDTNIPQD